VKDGRARPPPKSKIAWFAVLPNRRQVSGDVAALHPIGDDHLFLHRRYTWFRNISSTG
jgi:hypothetical protein